jgi:accessory gene regulator B
MVDKFCSFLINKMKKEMPDIDDERAEVIVYGLQLIIGEIPKILITFVIAYIIGVLKLTLITVLVLTPYRASSGGFHLKTHIGCILSTTLYYCGVAILAKYLIITGLIRYILALTIWVFGMLMVKLYAPADTENVPILRKSERKQKQILSYITLTIGLIVAVIINNPQISNILLFGNLIQSMMITRLAYRLTGSKYGYEVYENASVN